MHLKVGFCAKCSGVIALILLALSAAACSNAFAFTAEEAATIAAYRKVAPSVVNITTRICGNEFFFCVTPSMTGSASGVVLTRDGLIITNDHVIYGAQNIQVALSDGRRLKARIISSDPQDDLAVIKVDTGDKPLKTILLGDSNTLRVGQRVLAVGNPFGLGQTLTAGVVSMTGRTINDHGKILRNLIQTDAPINPGNSGGALVNLDGEMVGLCTAILSPTGSSIRIGFALPVTRIKAIAPGLMHPRGGMSLALLIAAILLAFWLLRRIYINLNKRDDPR